MSPRRCQSSSSASRTQPHDTARTVILANGAFPTHPVPCALLRHAPQIVCCDGATISLLAASLEPTAIVGDLDSLPPALRVRFSDRLHPDTTQDDNDLAKAFRFCLSQGWRELAILGGTGLREDHTLGNLGWLADFSAQADVVLLTDTGRFTAVRGTATLASFPGQQVSLFTFDAQTALHARGLRYALNGVKPTRWWQATLNEAVGDTFDLTIQGGPALVFQTYPAG